MSDGVFFLCSLSAGLIARLIFIPANIAAKRCGTAVTVIADIICSVLGGIPFAVLVFVFHSGITAFFAVAAFNAGLLFPSLVKLVLPKRKRKKLSENKP